MNASDANSYEGIALFKCLKRQKECRQLFYRYMASTLTECSFLYKQKKKSKNKNVGQRVKKFKFRISRTVVENSSKMLIGVQTYN